MDPQRSDAELVTAAGRGDTEAFETLYLRHRDWVVRLAWRFTRDEQAAMDVAQEAFIHLLRKLPTLRLTAKLTTYMYPIVRNIATTGHRLRIRRAEVEGDAPARVESTPGADSAGTGALASALDALPDAQREVVLMRIVDEMSLDEVSAALGIPEGTVKSRLHNALAALRADPALREYFLPEF